MEQRWLSLALELLRLPTAPFYEGAVIEWLLSFVRERGFDVERDRWGNLLVYYKRGRQRNNRPVLLAAHMDHPGFGALRMVDDRTLVALWRGGVPPELFAGARVRFHSRGRWVKGEVIHTQLDVEAGVPRETTVRVERAVEAGSAGMWDFPEPRLRGNLLYARGHDDVAGVAAIASALDEAARRRPEGEFYAFFTRAEEIGFMGAIGACKDSIIPKQAVIVALETSRELPNARPGDGVVVRVGDRTTIFTPWVSAALTSAAEELTRTDGHFKYARRLMDGGRCESAIYCDYGYDAGGLCLALRNYHNVNWHRMKLAPEAIDMGDFESLVRLLLAVAERGISASSGEDARRGWDEVLRSRAVLPSETAAWPGKRK